LPSPCPPTHSPSPSASGGAPHRPHLSEAQRTGAIFGVIEGITPLVGWALGHWAAPYVEAWDHWIAFALLGILGLRMIRTGLSGAADEAHEKPSAHSFWLLAVTGVATSIDALAVGVGLAFIDANILTVAGAIGLSTFVMATLGAMVGRGLGKLVGGVVPIGIGCAILVEHIGRA
jgi:putative Mn2+ efflux pump MntP